MKKPKPVELNRKFPVTTISKRDIIDFFSIRYRDATVLKDFLKKANLLTERDMLVLASKMEDDYIEQMQWESCSINFEELFMRKN